MQSIADGAVEVACVSGFEHDAKVIAISPVALDTQFRLHPLIEDGTRQRIREGNANVIRARFANEGDRLLKLVPALARISELQKVAGTNAGLLQALTRCNNRR